MIIDSAIVLAAGEGRRLRPLTKNRPKPMLPAARKPILEHVFDALIDEGVTDLTVVVGYQRNRVQSHFGPTYRNVPITYVVQEKQLGSGHALESAEHEHDDPVLVVYGDQLIGQELVSDIVQAHETEASTTATIGLVREADVTEYGGVLLNNDGTVIEIVENPIDDRDYALNAGVYAFDPAVFDAVQTTERRSGELSLVDVLSNLVEAETNIRGVVSDGTWIDATYPWDLLQIATDLLADKLTPQSTISSECAIHESATIVEPVLISPDCVIGAGAVVGPNVCLGDNVTVGSNTTIEHSILDTDTRVKAGVTLFDCIIGHGTHIGPGSTVVGGPGDVEIDGTIYQNEQLGAVLADRVRDNGGVTYRSGTVVGTDAVIHAGSTVDGSVDDDAEVYG